MVSVDRNRAQRMVDDGLDETSLTFDLGPPPSEEEVQQMLDKLNQAEKENGIDEQEER